MQDKIVLEFFDHVSYISRKACLKSCLFSRAQIFCDCCFGFSLISSSQPTASAYLLSVAMDGACLLPDSSLEIALLVVPIFSATAKA